MNMAEEAFREMWPGRELSYDFSIRYSGRFKGYNANVRLCGSSITFSLSRKWREVSRDIKIGLLQELMAKILGERGKKTPNIDLYHIFLKKVHIAVPKTKKDEALAESFSRVNDYFFAGTMEMPNLAWNKSSRKLGSYDYGSDTITISSMLKNADNEMVDYVMYHEMLHKKHKFNSKGGKIYHHTREFRSSEKAFPNSTLIEQKLRTLRPSASMVLRKKKRRFRLPFRFF
jgi:predicted SprT family Zn-dependent metalloprotease